MLPYEIFHEDLPDNFVLDGKSIAIDTEAMGLNIKRDRLCLVQMCDEKSRVVLVKYDLNSAYKSPNLIKLLEDSSVVKIFHFARFDVAILKHYLNIQKVENIFCTKIASKLARTYTDRHGLKTLVREVCSIVMDKEQQTSNWGADKLSNEQIEYAISDVIYLHRIKDCLTKMLQTENRLNLALSCSQAINLITDLDINDFGTKLFEHI
jgi:ribonuclease D